MGPTLLSRSLSLSSKRATSLLPRVWCSMKGLRLSPIHDVILLPVFWGLVFYMRQSVKTMLESICGVDVATVRRVDGRGN